MHFARAPNKKLQVDLVGVFGVIVFALLVAVVYALGSSQPFFEPPYLAVILQLIFVLGTSMAVVIISSKSYLRSGSINILFIGCSIS